MSSRPEMSCTSNIPHVMGNVWHSVPIKKRHRINDWNEGWSILPNVVTLRIPIWDYVMVENSMPVGWKSAVTPHCPLKIFPGIATMSQHF
jgi:hypothetical protein